MHVADVSRQNAGVQGAENLRIKEVATGDVDPGPRVRLERLVDPKSCRPHGGAEMPAARESFDETTGTRTQLALDGSRGGNAGGGFPPQSPQNP